MGTDTHHIRRPIKLTVNITMGNDACQFDEDIAAILELTASLFADSLASEDGGSIKDINGNKVSEYYFTYED